MIETQKPKLLERHRNEHRASSLSGDMIAEAGTCSSESPVNLTSILNVARRIDCERVPAIAFPFLDTDGAPAGYSRIDPDKPRINDDKLPRPVRIDGEQSLNEVERFTGPAISPRLAGLLQVGQENMDEHSSGACS